MKAVFIRPPVKTVQLHIVRLYCHGSTSNRSTVRYSVILALAAVLTACQEPGSFSNVPEDDRNQLREFAGEFARYCLYSPSCEERPEEPSGIQLISTMEICARHPEAWSYFYACVVDTMSELQPPEPQCQTGIQGYTEEEIQGTGTL
jgi:hypothetical protein